jgi:hypothetical protein
MAINTLTGWTNKFLQKLNTLTTQDKIDARTLIDAASHTDTVAALAEKQDQSDALDDYAGAANAAARRALIEAASTVSPNFTSPTCVTPTEGNRSTLIANTDFVQASVEGSGVFVAKTNADYEDPNYPTGVDISGITAPYGTAFSLERLVFVDGFGVFVNNDVNGAGLYQATLEHNGTDWVLSLTELTGLNDLVYTASKTSSATSPVGLTGWTVGTGTGSPVVTTMGPLVFGAFTGQIYRFGEGPSYTWYSWNGTTWSDITTV